MTYVYQCSCGKERKVEHTMKECDTHVETCECGNKMERKILGGNGFVLEGSTWYKDGYKSHGVINPER